MNLNAIKKRIQIEMSSIEKRVINKNHIVFELEADSTIPSEYIIMMHFFGEIDIKLEKKITKYLLSKQNKDGGWPLFYEGESNLSASVKSYFALKLSGFDPNSTQMIAAKKKIIEMGGAEKSNVFTRITLALFQQVSWKTVPSMPIEIMCLPKWFPFHLTKISYWSRTVVVPLLIIMKKKPIANNPNNVSISELFCQEQDYLRNLPRAEKENFLTKFFIKLDNLIKLIEPHFSQKLKKKSLDTAYEWIVKRLNDKDGLGGIFPAMVNALIALKLDNNNRFKSEIVLAEKALRELLVIKKTEAYCQPCLSPIWDTGWVGLAFMENKKNVQNFVYWLLEREIKIPGDWSENKPELKPGGWAFQFKNDFYPDVDDTALIGMLLHRYNLKIRDKKIDMCINRTKNWIIGMQSKNGGWGSFDVDNTYFYLNYIPFADHGALLDPPTADVSSRCISFLAQIQNKGTEKAIQRGVNYLVSQQEDDGSWYGRWGTNYIYGTWSALSALNLVEFAGKEKVFERSINYLKTTQQNDGGWGEDGRTYDKNFIGYKVKSTPSQTAWAIMGLISAGEIKSNAVKRGIDYLLRKKEWNEDLYTAVGFPKVFYLKYHGYSKYFPLLALSKYKNLIKSNSQKPVFGA